MRRHDTISFLTDYGLADEFVGVVKSVIRSVAPAATVIDITHEIPPFDVRAGSLALVRTVNYLCPGVLLAVVDPGVGTSRKAIAVEVGGGESVLVGPDNGLLAPAVALLGGAGRAVELNRPNYWRSEVSSTFAGRDVFAPVVAHLCNGVDLYEVGTPIPPEGLVPGLVPFSAEENGVLHAEVLWVDRFGNAQLNVTPDQISTMGAAIACTLADRRFVVRRVSTFGDLRDAENGILEDASGLLAIVKSSASAEAELGMSPGTSISLEPAD